MLFCSATRKKEWKEILLLAPWKTFQGSLLLLQFLWLWVFQRLFYDHLQVTSTWDCEIIFKVFTVSASWKLRFSFSLAPIMIHLFPCLPLFRDWEMTCCLNSWWISRLSLQAIFCYWITSNLFSLTYGLGEFSNFPDLFFFFQKGAVQSSKISEELVFWHYFGLMFTLTLLVT